MKSKTIFNGPDIAIFIGSVTTVAMFYCGWHFLQSRAADSPTSGDLEYQTQLAELNSQVTQARAANKARQEVTEQTLSATDPAVLVQRLVELSGNESQKIRIALYCFQGLVDAGTNSLPAICNYLDGGYNTNLRQADPDTLRTPTDNLSPIIIVPSTVRLGLENVLNEIGGTKAIEILGQILASAPDANEVLYLSNLLLAVDFNQFCDTAMIAARKAMDSSASRQQKRDLLNLLVSLGDNSLLAGIAYEAFFDHGNLSQSDLATLVSFSGKLGTDVMPILKNSFDNPETSLASQQRLMLIGMEYAGENADANAMFQTVMESEAFDAKLKGLALTALAGFDTLGSAMGLRRDTDQIQTLSPEVAQERLGLLEECRQTYAEDATLAPILRTVEEHLQYAAHTNSGSDHSTDFVSIVKELITTKITTPEGYTMKVVGGI